jgi:hypothetical protein
LISHFAFLMSDLEFRLTDAVEVWIIARCLLLTANCKLITANFLCLNHGFNGLKDYTDFGKLMLTHWVISDVGFVISDLWIMIYDWKYRVSWKSPLRVGSCESDRGQGDEFRSWILEVRLPSALADGTRSEKGWFDFAFRISDVGFRV